MKTETFFKNLKKETDKLRWKIKIIPSGPRDPLYYDIIRKYRNTKSYFLFWKKWFTAVRSQKIREDVIIPLSKKSSKKVIFTIIQILKGGNNG